MIKINLLPEGYEKARAKLELNIILGSFTVVLIVVMISIYAVYSARAASLEKKIQKTDAELRKYQMIVDQIKSIEQQKNKLVQKRDTIKSVDNSRLLYPHFFEDLLPLIPSDVWVTDFKLDKQSDNTLEYKLSSKALSNYALATWLTNLEQSNYFKSVKLDKITYEVDKTIGEATPVLNFQIGFVYQHP